MVNFVWKWAFYRSSLTLWKSLPFNLTEIMHFKGYKLSMCRIINEIFLVSVRIEGSRGHEKSEKTTETSSQFIPNGNRHGYSHKTYWCFIFESYTENGIRVVGKGCWKNEKFESFKLESIRSFKLYLSAEKYKSPGVQCWRVRNIFGFWGHKLFLKG